MKKLFFALVLLSQIVKPSDKIVVGYYYADYSSYSHKQIDYSKLTHIAHAFIRPNLNGSIGTDYWFYYPDLITEAHNNGVKIVAAVGGWGNSDNFKPVCADTALRRKFVNNLVEFCSTNGYDGIDLDWEYPGVADKANFVALATELRAAFDIAGIELISAALPSTDWNGVYNISALKDKLDWFGIMTYDFYGPWETNSGHNSPLYSSSSQYYSTNSCLNQYINAGIPKNKLCLGIPFYGYNFKSSALYSAITQSQSSSISYVNANAKKLTTGWQYYWDDICKVPYLQDADKTRIIVYDDTTSVKLKCEYIHKINLAGAIIWKIGQDHSSGSTPLLNMIGKYLLNVPVNTPAAPVALLPSDGATQNYSSIQFTWQPTDSTTSYNIQVDTAITFASPLFYKKGINLTYFTKTNLMQNKTYYWRVNSTNIAGTGEWSAIKSFVTNGQSTIVENQNNLPGKYTLENYPNPFNPSTVIRFSMPQSGSVSLKVFNALGEEVAVLVNDEFREAGDYNISFVSSFNGMSLPSGIYIYTLQTEHGIYCNKMLLVK